MTKNYSLSERAIIYILLDLCLISSGISTLISALKSVADVNGLIIWTIGVLYEGYHAYLCIVSGITRWIDDSCFWGKIFGLYYTLRLKEYKFQDLLFLRGMILNYFKSIDNDEFTLFTETNSLPIFTSDNPEAHRAALNQIIEFMFDAELKICTDGYQIELLTLAKSQYLIEISHKSSTALSMLTELQTVSAAHEIYRHKLIRLINSSKYLAEYKGRELAVLKLARNSGRLKKLMKTQGMITIKLWNNISTSQPDIAIINDLVLECLKVRSEIKELWSSIESYNTSAPELSRMYISYKELLCGDCVMEQKWRQLYHFLNNIETTITLAQ